MTNYIKATAREPEGGWDSKTDRARAKEFLAKQPDDLAYDVDGFAVYKKMFALGISPDVAINMAANRWQLIFSNLAIRQEFGNGLIAAYAESKLKPGYDSGGDEFESSSKSKSGIVAINADEVEPRNVEFLWKNRLAIGMHTVLAGIGGRAKSQIMYSIIAAITTGGKWPDGGNAPQGRCVILSAEEGVQDMIVPRLMAAGADLKQVKIINAVTGANAIERKFSLQEDLQRLKAYCAEVKDVRLIGFDPVSSYMGGDLDTHRNTAVRHVLDPITRLAEDARCTILSITHFNKGSSSQAIHRVMESAAFVNAPRASFGVFDDPDNPNARLMLMLKTNMGEPPPGLRYHVDAIKCGKDTKTGAPIVAPRVVWDGETDMTADEVVQAQGGPAAPKTEQAKAFLCDQLADGPKAVPYIKAQSEAEGISPYALRTALGELGIKAVPTKGKVPPEWHYRLPDASASDAEDDFG